MFFTTPHRRSGDHKVLIPMNVKKENRKYVSRKFRTDVFHHATPHIIRKQQQPPHFLGSNSVDHGKK
jgi:hypothetical protein